MFDQDGGGFTSPARGGDSGGGFNSPGNTGGKATRTRVQNLVPCTINQIRTARKEDDRFLIGTMELGQIELFGIIMDSREASTNVTYMLNDFTGEDIQVRHWLEEADDDAAGARESQVYKKHTLVRICGNVRELQGTRSLVAFRIFPVHDFNEFSCHILEVIHAQMLHQMLTSGGGGSIVSNAMDTTASNDNAPTTVKGLTPVQNKVLAFIRDLSPASESGPRIDKILAKFAGAFSDRQIREAIEFLSNEGHVYSTLDEDHYRATDL